MSIIRVKRFGGSRELDPPGWGVLEINGDGTGNTLLFHGGAHELMHGSWWLDMNDTGAWWHVDDSDVPDEVWASLAKWRLLNGKA